MFKSKAPEKEKDAANVAEVVGRAPQQQHSVVEQPPPRPEPMTKAGTGSCIGSGMSGAGFRPNQRRVARLKSSNRRWRTD
jgi:hypothetical protein